MLNYCCWVSGGLYGYNAENYPASNHNLMFNRTLEFIMKNQKIFEVSILISTLINIPIKAE
jgi:hypothetical protein